MIKRSLATSLTIMLTLLLLLSTVAPVMAQKNEVEARRGEPITASLEQGPTDPAEMEAFMDGLLKQEMEEYHIAGAAVSVVKE